LQKEGVGELDMHEVRVLFNRLIDEFPITAQHLSANASIIDSKNFDKGIVKVQGGFENTLTREEKAAISRFLINDGDGVEAEVEEEPSNNFALNILRGEQSAKRARLSVKTRYRSTKHITSTSNCVERLFSRAKIVMTDLRKNMTPFHLEMLMFLRYNCHLWSVETIQTIIDTPAAVEQQEGGDDNA
jgi:hypothetical protein